MFTVEFANEVGINWDGGFEYEYTANGQPKITAIWDKNGKPCRVSKKLYKQFCNYAQSCLKSWQEMTDEAIATKNH